MAEYKLAEKGMPIWKEQLRSAIDEAKGHSRNLVDLKDYLKENFNIEMKIQNKHLSYLYPDKKKYCRGNKLGYSYTKEKINAEFERSRGSAVKEDKKLEKLSASCKGRSPAISLNSIGSGMDNITQKIARDIEKENIRVQKTKEHKYHSREKYKIKDRGRER
jgi:hypothetical protein